jgi:hypothetical protein
MTMNFSAIHSLFDCAISQGLKYPRIRLQTTYGLPVVISRNGGKSKNPGHLSVTNGGKYGTPDNIYFGRITPEGQWIPSSYAAGNALAVVAVLTKLAANPAEVAREHGRLTGFCIFCETKLSDPRSTANGYGPICAGHFGLPWDAAKEAKKAVPVDLQAVLADAYTRVSQKPTRNERILENGYQAYAREEGHEPSDLW